MTERVSANARTNKRLHKLNSFCFKRESAMPWFTHIGLVMSHKHGEVGEVAAGAGGVCAVGVQQLAALRRPLARHGALRVVPEGAIWRVIIVQLQSNNKERNDR